MLEGKRNRREKVRTDTENCKISSIESYSAERKIKKINDQEVRGGRKIGSVDYLVVTRENNEVYSSIT